MVPSAVRAVRVTKWYLKTAKGTKSSPCATAEAELEVRPEVSREGCCRPVEGFEVEVVSSAGKMNASLHPLIFSLGAVVRVPGLTCGTQAELRVRAWNALGRSEPVALRIAVPKRARKFPAIPDESGSLPEGCVAARPYPSKLPQSSRVAAPTGDSPLATSSQTPRFFSQCEPLFSCRHFSIGSRVQAKWAGDGEWYDAVIRRFDGDGWATVDWLRPTPLGDETLHCVCECGGDDTMHRRVLCENLRSSVSVQSVASCEVTV